MLATNQTIQQNLITNPANLVANGGTLRALFFIFLAGSRITHTHNLAVLVTTFTSFNSYNVFISTPPRLAMLSLASAYFRRNHTLLTPTRDTVNSSCASTLMLCPAFASPHTAKPAKLSGLNDHTRYSGGGEAQLDVLLRFLETCLQSRVSIILLRSQYSLLQQDAVVDILSLRARLEF
jgi:hypothetical protein